jgi:hypothetical protein
MRSSFLSTDGNDFPPTRFLSLQGRGEYEIGINLNPFPLDGREWRVGMKSSIS